MKLLYTTHEFPAEASMGFAVVGFGADGKLRVFASREFAFTASGCDREELLDEIQDCMQRALERQRPGVA